MTSVCRLLFLMIFKYRLKKLAVFHVNIALPPYYVIASLVPFLVSLVNLSQMFCALLVDNIGCPIFVLVPNVPPAPNASYVPLSKWEFSINIVDHIWRINIVLSWRGHVIAFNCIVHNKIWNIWKEQKIFLKT